MWVWLILACVPDTSAPLAAVVTLTGEATWTADFDAAAEAAGLVDCSYTRAYDGSEDRSVPWLCPGCDAMFRLDTELVRGEPCHKSVSSLPVDALEWHGPAGEGWRRAGPNLPLSRQGTAPPDADVRRWTNSTDWVAAAAGQVRFTVDGTFREGEGRGDPWHGNRPQRGEYGCGWPRADPPAWEGPWTVREGKTLPDGWFEDQCFETVRLHDFAGRWLIVELSALDCPPCQDMAAGEAAFVEAMAAEGITVEVITLLVPSLGDPFGDTAAEQQIAWAATYGLRSPVLADRGWGPWVLGDALDGGLSFPAWAVVDPSLEVVAVGSGFGGWDRFRPYLSAD
ncbi:MAG: hypothetical protein ACI8PZ_002067 [Myxococcota bacterium]|jgi:hypothetical protein